MRKNILIVPLFLFLFCIFEHGLSLSCMENPQAYTSSYA